MSAVTIRAKIREDGHCSMLARVTAIEGSGTQVTGDLGKPVLQADVSTITCKVFDLGTDPNATSGTEVGSAPSVVVASTIFDTLQTTGWDVNLDSSGYNFRHAIAGATYFTDGGDYFAIEYKFTLTSATVFWVVYRVQAVAVLTS